jgi:hypothetical protein
MKPTSPEDRDLEKMSSEVSERYRAGAEDEPSARLDAAVLAAARREVEQPRQRRIWHVPAAIAAMLVIGVSLVLIVRDNEPPLPSLDRPAADEAKLAKPAPPQLAMKAQPKARADSHREDRPSRERSARLDREPVTRDEAAATQENTASGTAPPPAPASAAPVVAGRTKSAEQEQSRIAESSDFSSSKKAKALAEAATESRLSTQALRKEDATEAAQPKDWLEKIDDLLREGKEAEARRQLLGFRQHYPHYPLPERLQALLPPDQR